MDNLSRDARAAKAAGMSYGKWKALQPVRVPTPRNVPKGSKPCQWCGKYFVPNVPHRKCCSPECSNAKHEDSKRKYKLEHAADNRAAEYDRIDELYNQGKTDQEIAAEVGCSIMRVRRWRYDQGLEPNLVVRDIHRNRIDYTEIDKEIIAGKKPYIIALKHGCSDTTVVKRKRKLKAEGLLEVE